jgi:hypothetical protein
MAEERAVTSVSLGANGIAAMQKRENASRAKRKITFFRNRAANRKIVLSLAQNERLRLCRAHSVNFQITSRVTGCRHSPRESLVRSCASHHVRVSG